MANNPLVIHRYIASPTHYNKEPYGTFCSVMQNDEGTEQEYYVQVSKDEDNPRWMSAGELLLAVYDHKIEDLEFLQKLLKDYSQL